MKSLRPFSSNLDLYDFKRILAPDFLINQDWNESEKRLSIEYDMPGVEKSNIQVNCQNGILHIKGVKETKKDSNSIKKEYNFTIYLPENIDESKIEAEYTNGILTVSGPKKENSESQNIQIKVK